MLQTEQLHRKTLKEITNLYACSNAVVDECEDALGTCEKIAKLLP